MIQSWENWVTDGRTDGQTDGQTDESDFIGRCPTNVDRPITKFETVLNSGKSIGLTPATIQKQPSEVFYEKRCS